MTLILLGIGVGVLSALAAFAVMAWNNAREFDQISRELRDDSLEGLRRADRTK